MKRLIDDKVIDAYALFWERKPSDPAENISDVKNTPKKNFLLMYWQLCLMFLKIFLIKYEYD